MYQHLLLLPAAMQISQYHHSQFNKVFRTIH